MYKTIFLLSVLTLALSGCMPCSMAGCAASLELETALPGRDVVQVEVCRGTVCYGPVDMFDDDERGFETLALTDTFRLDVSRYDTLETESSVRVMATMYPQEEAPSEEEWTLRVTDSVGTIVEETVTPTYVRAFPNGESCGPTCYQARVQITAQP